MSKSKNPKVLTNPKGIKSMEDFIRPKKETKPNKSRVYKNKKS